MFAALAIAAVLSVALWEVAAGDESAPVEPRAVSISVGVDHACALLEDRSLVCWLEDWLDGDIDARDLAYLQVSAGDQQACGVTDHGRLICQGWGSVRELGEPGARYQAVDTGSAYHATCAIRRDGSLWCHEEAWHARHSLPDGRYQSLSLGFGFGCALRLDGRVDCWGRSGRWGDLLPPTPSGEFTALSAGAYFTCALDRKGEITCWGDNYYGQLESPPGRYVAIDAGGDRACALDEAHQIVCWGNVRLGESPPPGAFRELSVGLRNACAITMEGRVACWGGQDETWLGSAGVYLPNGAWRWVSDGSGRQCVLRETGELFCRGGLWYGFHLAAAEYLLFDNRTWQSCGIRTDGTLACPARLSLTGDEMYRVGEPAGRYQQVETSARGSDSWHSCALHEEGWVTCWGHNSFGQASAPKGRFTKIAVASRTSCALGDDGSVTCWGEPFTGPVRSGSLRWTERFNGPFVDVAMTSSRVCAIREDGRVACKEQRGWQDSDAALGRHVEIAITRSSTCALTSTGTFNCWLGGDVGRPPDGSGLVRGISGEVRLGTLLADSGRVCGTLQPTGIACWDDTRSTGKWRSAWGASDMGFARLVDARSYYHQGSDYCGITDDGAGVCGDWSEGPTLRLSNMSLIGDEPERDQRAQAVGGWRGRFAMRHLGDGSAALRVEPEGARRDEATTWHLPPSSAGAQWRPLGDVVVDGESWGSLQARRWDDGTVEASLLTASGDRVLERGRFLPPQAPIGEWQRSGVIHVPAPVTHVTPRSNPWDSGYVRVFRADGTSAALRPFDEKDERPTDEFKLAESGPSGTCAITRTDHVTCTGSLRTLAPSGRFVSLAVGREHACGVRESGELSCWGSNAFGQASPPRGEFREVSAGGAHSCAISVGRTLSCWGLNWQGQASPPTDVFRSVTSGMAHSCAIRRDDALVCWGANGHGQSSAPEAGYRSISAAGWHTCGVTVDYRALCWGSEQDEYAAPEGYQYSAVFASGFRNYGVTLGGGLVWWGWYECRYSRGHSQIPADSVWGPEPIVQIPSGKAWCS